MGESSFTDLLPSLSLNPPYIMKIFSWASALKQIPLTWVSTTRNIDLSGPLRGLVASQPQPGPVMVLSKAPQTIQKYKFSMARPTMLFTQSYISHLLLTEGRRRSTCNDPSSYFIKTINKTRSGDTGAVVPAPISATQEPRSAWASYTRPCLKKTKLNKKKVHFY